MRLNSKEAISKDHTFTKIVLTFIALGIWFVISDDTLQIKKKKQTQNTVASLGAVKLFTFGTDVDVQE